MLLTIGRGLSPHQRGATVITPSLQDVLASCVFDLDATQSASYDGTSQTWHNLVAAPAGGDAKASYDFYLGANNTATTDDPTFNGTAGNSAAYFSFDGGDYFDAVSMPNTTYLRNIHRTDSSRPVTFGFAFRTPGTLATARLISTYRNSSSHGLGLRLNSNGNVDIIHANGSATPSAIIVPNSTLQVSTNYLLLVSFNSGSTGDEKYWLNNSTSSNWNASYAPNSTSTAGTQVPSIGALPEAHTNPFGSGTRLYGVYMFNEIFDNAKAAAVITALNTRHGRTYA